MTTKALWAAALLAGLALTSSPALAQEPASGTPTPPASPSTKEAPPDKIELSFGWRPAFHSLKLVFSDDEPIRGNGVMTNSWRLALKVPQLFGVHRLDGNIELEYFERTLDVKTGDFEGGMAGHAFYARTWFARPIALDDADLIRLSPQLGLIFPVRTGGYGQFIELPNHAEIGLLLGVQIEKVFDVEDTNRIGGSVQAGLMSMSLNVADDEIGKLDQASELRLSLWWNTRITDMLRFEVRYILTHDIYNFRMVPTAGGGRTGFRADEIDNALCLGIIAKF